MRNLQANLLKGDLQEDEEDHDEGRKKRETLWGGKEQFRWRYVEVPDVAARKGCFRAQTRTDYSCFVQFVFIAFFLFYIFRPAI